MNFSLEAILDGIDSLLQHGVALALLLGLAVSILGTQALKYWIRKWRSRELNLCAVVLGFVTTFSTWPVHELNAIRFFLALTIGLLAPVIFKVGARVLVHFWPSLAGVLSKRRTTEPRE